jgi:hypothetical protein
MRKIHIVRHYQPNISHQLAALENILATDGGQLANQRDHDPPLGCQQKDIRQCEPTEDREKNHDGC